MDDLDKELFGSTLKKLNPSLLKKASKTDTDFDEDDPLGDLLSSSGENTPVKSLSRKSSSKEATDLSLKQQSKSKLIADLFGLNKDEINSGLGAPTASTATNLTYSTSKPTNKVEDPGDWLGLKAEPDFDHVQNTDLKYDENPASNSTPLNSFAKVHSKEDSSLPALTITDSFKTTHPPQNIAADDLATQASVPAQRRGVGLQESKKTNLILSSFISDFDSKPKSSGELLETQGNETEIGFDVGKNSYIPTPSFSREPRRSTRQRGNIVDPLGLFAPSSKTIQNESVVPKETQVAQKEKEPSQLPLERHPQVSNSDPMPQWLEGASTVSASQVPSQKESGTISTDACTDTKQPIEYDVDILTGLANSETLAAEVSTQHQKSLLTALALKRQEDTLLKLQAQQSSLLAQHEQQLGALVQRQVQRQQQMIRQQEQIQAHIQALLVQPPAIAPISFPTALWNIRDNSIENNDPQFPAEAIQNQNEKNMEIISELKGHIQRLETEIKDFRSKLECEKQRHNDHLSDVENIFRKQLTVLEEAMVKQEKRFHTEIEAVEKEATSRITRVKEDYDETSRQQAQRMAQLHGEWLADLQRLGEFHQQSIEMLRLEQTSTIDHWKNSQIAEIEAIKESGSNSRLLEAAVNYLKESTASLMDMKNQIRKEAESQLSEKEKSILKQEVQLAGLREAVEKQIEALEAERSCILTMNQDLQSRLLRQQEEFNVERNRFESREKAWEREKLGAIDLLNQEKQNLEKLQSQARTEMAELGERKIALAADVARLETTLQIQNKNACRSSYQAEQMVAEARSTLEAAQEAGLEVVREREDIEALKLTLNAEQKRLAILEQEIQTREQRSEEELVRAKALKEEGISALNEARRLERERSEHASDIAQRLLHLKEREDRLAEEKLAVTMEWKRIQEIRDTSSCLHHGQMAVTTFEESIVDPLPIIMKLEAEQGFDFITLDHPHSTLLDSVSQ